MTSPPRKRRTREHVIADLSVNHVERQALLCGFAVERTTRDYGIDLNVFTFNKKGEAEPGKILLQLKATDRLRRRSESDSCAVRIDRKDLVLWLAQPMPVILIVYDARHHVAYWLYVQSYFRKLKDFNLFAVGKTITVRIAVSHVVNPGAMRKFARFRDRLLEQMTEVVHDDDNLVR